MTRYVDSLNTRYIAAQRATRLAMLRLHAAALAHNMPGVNPDALELAAVRYQDATVEELALKTELSLSIAGSDFGVTLSHIFRGLPVPV